MNDEFPEFLDRVVRDPENADCAHEYSLAAGRILAWQPDESARGLHRDIALRFQLAPVKPEVEEPGGRCGTSPPSLRWSWFPIGFTLVAWSVDVKDARRVCSTSSSLPESRISSSEGRSIGSVTASRDR